MTSFPPIDMLSPEERERFFDGPAQFPPEGVIPRPNDRPNNNAVALGLTIGCVILTGSGVVLRAYSQIVVKKRVGIEDGLGLLAFVAFCGTVWTTFQLLDYRMFDNHQWDISVRDFVEILFALYIWPTLYTLIMAFIKPAILLEWAKLFVPKGVRNRFWWTCMILVGFNCCVYIATFVAIQMYCTPHERIWKRWVPGTCVNRKSVDFPSSVFNLLQDILILLLPQGVIWRLQMSRSRKISVSIVFAIGILAVVCAAGRVQSIATLVYDDDVTYYAGRIYLWSMAECTCVMLVFCIPPIPRIFTTYAFLRNMLTALRCPMTTFKSTKGSKISEGSERRYMSMNSGYAKEGAKDSRVQLTNLQPVVRASSEADQASRGIDYGIVCTRTFSTQEHYMHDQYPPRHPGEQYIGGYDSIGRPTPCYREV